MSLLILLGAPIAEPVVIAGSANIPPGGVNTTAQLTPPTGKTTANFQPGRAQDDSFLTSAINLAADAYTEIEYPVKLVGTVVVALEQYEFRLVDENEVPLTDYTATPIVTVGTGAAAQIGAATASLVTFSVGVATVAGINIIPATANQVTFSGGASTAIPGPVSQVSTAVVGTFSNPSATPIVAGIIAPATAALATFDLGVPSAALVLTVPATAAVATFSPVVPLAVPSGVALLASASVLTFLPATPTLVSVVSVEATSAEFTMTGGAATPIAEVVTAAVSSATLTFSAAIAEGGVGFFIQATASTLIFSLGDPTILTFAVAASTPAVVTFSANVAGAVSAIGIDALATVLTFSANAPTIFQGITALAAPAEISFVATAGTAIAGPFAETIPSSMLVFSTGAATSIGPVVLDAQPAEMLFIAAEAFVPVAVEPEYVSVAGFRRAKRRRAIQYPEQILTTWLLVDVQIAPTFVVAGPATPTIVDVQTVVVPLLADVSVFASVIGKHVTNSEQTIEIDVSALVSMDASQRHTNDMSDDDLDVFELMLMGEL
jgi:hypothetical protein